ncbi:hypothetical protein [Kocuria rosea]|uniref:hypothetical protein n=1 Tax=Kocuria rosea TaxID=1275 RepID=UPI00203FB28A|nr:hypothetical protein [Kocuria rosea]MCM3689051.1 hypothetical protein [Kocuria rosea]
MPLEEVNAEIGLPWGLGKVGGTWRPDDAERAAAWEMLVELSTRVALAELRPGEGLLREALSSHYALFGVTRDLLRRHGVATARPNFVQEGTVSFAALSISMLNGAIRPLLAYWHPVLRDYEERKPWEVSSIDWERQWDKAEVLRKELADVRSTLMAYAGLIADVCDARPVLGAINFNPPCPPGQAGE